MARHKHSCRIGSFHLKRKPYSVTGTADLVLCYETERGKQQELHFKMDVHDALDTRLVMNEIVAAFKEQAEELLAQID